VSLTYERFMRPLLDELSPASTATFADLRTRVADRMQLPAAVRSDTVAWDGMPVVEARLRKAAADLEQAGVVTREGDQVRLTEAGRRALVDLPAELSVDVLAEHFPDYAAYRGEWLQRRGA
jgi:restriction endonuclease Mrr